MGDFKSKLPNFNELSSMAGKLFKGIKSSVEEIIHDYKEKRAEETKAPEEKPKECVVAAKSEKTTAKKPAAAPKTTKKKKEETE